VNILKHRGQYLLLPLGEMAQDLKVRVRQLQSALRPETQGQRAGGSRPERRRTARASRAQAR
jgi:hypothetical protein